jgi:hypothetical protein
MKTSYAVVAIIFAVAAAHCAIGAYEATLSSRAFGALRCNEAQGYVWGADSASGIEASRGRRPPEKAYDSDLCITHLDISLKADFLSNAVPVVAKATIENTSQKTVEKAEFRICQTGNDPGYGADVRHIYFLEKGERRDLEFTMREKEALDREKHGVKETCLVCFERPIEPGEKLEVEFEYTIRGEPDYSSTPIHEPKEGLKQLYLRGGDWNWCPWLYVKSRPRVYARLHNPSWRLRIEYPAGYVAVVNGEPAGREERGGVTREEWTSEFAGVPHVYISKYQVVRLRGKGVTLEVYSPDEEALKKASERFDDYVRILKLYTELFGDPGSSVYRIVGSPNHGGGIGCPMLQVVGTVGRGGVGDARLVAHEMAHTWWGGVVWSHGEGTKFLREAMATFSEQWAMRALGEENHYGGQYFDDDWIRLEKVRFFCLFFAVPEAAFVPLIQQDGYDTEGVSLANYGKGPLVVNHLRLTLGDEVFFKFLKAFAREYRGRFVDIHDFLETIGRVSGKDVTAELRGLLWSGGHASYRLVSFASEKDEGGYRTRVSIRNEGAYGLTCPVLLKTEGEESRELFKVGAKGVKEFVFATEDRVVEVVIDPDLTSLQYHPDQKASLWQAIKPMGDWGWYGRSCAQYCAGEYEEAVETITERFVSSMTQKKLKSLAELVERDRLKAAFLFMRGVYYLALNNRERAEEDVRMAFPYMLDELQRGGSVGAPGAYYQTGAILEENPDEYLALLGQIAGREFSFEAGSDDEAKRQQVEQWKQWWEKEGTHQKLGLDRLERRFKAQRRVLLER